MAFNVRMGVPQMAATWAGLSARKRQGKLDTLRLEAGFFVVALPACFRRPQVIWKMSQKDKTEKASLEDDSEVRMTLGQLRERSIFARMQVC